MFDLHVVVYGETSTILPKKVGKKHQKNRKKACQGGRKGIKLA